MQKAQGDIQQAVAATNGHIPDDISEGDAGKVVIHEDGTMVRASMDDQASTRAIISPPSTESVERSPIPTIKISTDGDDDYDDEKEEGDAKGKRKADESGDADDEADEPDGGEEQEAKKVDAPAPVNGQVKDMDTLEKPVQAAGEGEQNINESSPPPAQEPFSFSNKRLCERWLDNLFMVLYEVSRFPSPRVLP